MLLRLSSQKHVRLWFVGMRCLRQDREVKSGGVIVAIAAGTGGVIYPTSLSPMLATGISNWEGPGAKVGRELGGHHLRGDHHGLLELTHTAAMAPRGWHHH